MAAAERKEVIDVPLKTFFDVVCDFSSYPEFVTGMKKAKLLGEEGGRKKVEFELELMKRVQYVVSLAQTMDGNAGTAKVDWHLVSSEAMKVNNGTWLLKALGPQKTEVTYKLEVEVNFPVPGFIMRGLVGNSLPTAIKEFVDRAKKRS